MILIALGSNLPHPTYGDSRAVLTAAVARIGETPGFVLGRRSSWYRTAPWPPSDQPDYVNGVVEIAGDLGPEATMRALHAIEDEFGRTRTQVNAARILDLDLLAYDDFVSPPGAWPQVPHPRLAERVFVLAPLAELAPAWRHPVLGRSAAALLAALDDKAGAERLA
ncbi:MAG TPA: 2-amino-4-hydroxy-6-hydroxymethyldihydropteridine diphosphokinase [Kiloniellaceae bacterium]|nr:2-amino-4-hydroxy-6-hydroxymethyldihydropteridine diphosphokinase [Kiloniellaceae bacterium]